MNFNTALFSTSCRFLIGSVLFSATALAFGQVSPTEVLNPRARADEQKYLPHLVAIQKAIGNTDFPFTFRLARYLNAKPGQRAALDSNGLEFVYFQQRVVLKVSGIYRVAFDSVKVSENARASQALQEATLPILRLITHQMPPSNDYDAIGFEILYDARDDSQSFDYEGREVLTAVFSRTDAFALAKATTDEDRQAILNRSDIFVNGKELGLALGRGEPLNVETLERSDAKPVAERASFKSAKPVRAAVSPDVADDQGVHGPTPSASDSDPQRVQEKLQAQVTAIRNGDGVTLQPADKAPSLETSGDQKLLHFTLQNTLSFEKSQTSIYKRAAQSFDLFLAPELKDISKKVPTDAPVDALAISILNHFETEKNPDETIEFICPMDSMRSFVEDRITSQDLINKSKVLVNGVRIGLDLQQVE